MKRLPSLTIALLAASAVLAVAAPDAAQADASSDDGLRQLTSPVETISLRQEVDREVCITGQRSRGGRLVLTPDT